MWLLLPLLVTPCMSDVYIEAANCSEPLNISSYALPDPKDCLPVNIDTPTKHSLLTEVRSLAFTATVCRIEESYIEMYCGAYSHNKIINYVAKHPTTVAPEICIQMEQTGTISVRNITHNIKMGQTLLVSDTGEGNITFNKANTYCNGTPTKFKVNNQEFLTIDQIIRLTSSTISISTRTLIWTPEGTRDPTAQKLLSIGNDDESFLSNYGDTYIFDPPRNLLPDCSLHMIRSSLGMIVDNHFISDHDNLYIQLTNETHNCIPWARKTEYDGIFISSSWLTDDYPSATARDINLLTHLAASNDYFKWRTTEALRTRVCQHRTDITAEETGIAWELNGDFATLRGDSVIVFSCPRLELKILNTTPNGQCFTELAVGSKERPVYVSPVHHIITDYPTTTLCSKRFAPRYKTLNGSWISQHPDLAREDDPSPFPNPFAIGNRKPKLFNQTSLKEFHDMISLGEIHVSTLSKLVTIVNPKWAISHTMSMSQTLNDVSASLANAIQPLLTTIYEKLGFQKVAPMINTLGLSLIGAFIAITILWTAWKIRSYGHKKSFALKKALTLGGFLIDIAHIDPNLKPVNPPV